MPPIAKGPLQPITDIVTPGQRAMIVDRTGQPLAISEPTREAFADPNAIGDPVAVAQQLKTILPRLDLAGRDQAAVGYQQAFRLYRASDHAR